MLKKPPQEFLILHQLDYSLIEVPNKEQPLALLGILYHYSEFLTPF